MNENPDPNKIDIELSLLGGQSGVDFTNFVNELKAIRSSLGSMVTDAQRALQEARQMAQHQQRYDAGPSRPGSGTDQQRGQGGASSGRSAQDEAMATRGGVVLPPGYAGDSSQATPSQQGLPVVDEAKTRGRLGRIAQAFASPGTFGQKLDRGGNEAVHGGKSSGASSGGGDVTDGPAGTPEEETPESAGGRTPLRALHYGEYTSQELLQTLASGVSSLGKRGGRADNPRPGYEGAADMLQFGANQVPKYNLAKQYAENFAERGGYTIGGKGLEGLGAELGANPNEGLGPLPGQIKIPGTGIGVRVPFLNQAAIKGMQEQFEKFKMNAQPGINGQQSKFIFDQLYERGYRPGASQTNEFRSASASIMQANPALGQNPEVYNQMDKSLRYGTGNLKSFVKTIKEVPDAAKKANVSMEQMLADMDAVGEYSQSQGGTYQKGHRDAVDFSKTTGLSPQIFASAAQNPFIQAKTATQLGMPPGMLGAAPGGLVTENIFSAVNQLAAGMGAPRSQKVPIGKTGRSQTISGKDQQVAQLHAFFPELSPEILKRMLDPRASKTLEGGQSAIDLARMKSTQIGASGHSDVRDKEIEDAFTRMHGSRTMGRDDMKKIAEATKGKHGKDLETARLNAIKDLVGKEGLDLTSDENAGKAADRRVTIKLDPSAEKFFNLEDTYRENNRDNTHAGKRGGPIKGPNGPTQIIPRPLTGGGNADGLDP